MPKRKSVRAARKRAAPKGKARSRPAPRKAAKKLTAPAPKLAAPPPRPPVDYGQREDFGMSVEAWVAKVKSPAKAILEKVRALIREVVPDAVEEIKWGRPVFSKNGLLCYVKPFGSYVAFGFFSHTSAMRDPDGLLEGGGDGGHVKLKSGDDIRPELFREWVKLAADRNARA